jgi:hypothetical protein
VDSIGAPVIVLAVLETHKVIVSRRGDGLYVFQSQTELQVAPLQAVVSPEMVQWLSDTFNIPLGLFYQKGLALN